MNPNDSILIADIIRYAYRCHNYEAAAPIIHLLDKYCGTTDHAQEIDELKQYFKTLHYGAGMTCATCASAHRDESVNRDERIGQASTLSKVVIQGHYPNWKFVDVKPEVSDHFWLVAKTFLGYWNKIG